jgi:hypothetical protein
MNGLYKISNKGNIKSLPKFIRTTKDGQGYISKERYIKPHLGNRGYMVVSLCKNGKVKTYFLHRLLATTFMTCVNHKDGNKLNNSLENLELCTYGHNEKEAYRLKLKKGVWCEKTNQEHPMSKKVIQYDLNDNYLRTWESASEIKRQLKISVSSISQCCSKRNKSAGGYKWRYENE